MWRRMQMPRKKKPLAQRMGIRIAVRINPVCLAKLHQVKRQHHLKKLSDAVRVCILRTSDAPPVG